MAATIAEIATEVAGAWRILGDEYAPESEMYYELSVPKEQYLHYLNLAIGATNRAEKMDGIDRIKEVYNVMEINSRYIYLIELLNRRPEQTPGTSIMIQTIRYKCLQYLTSPGISDAFHDLLTKLLAKITLIRNGAVEPVYMVNDSSSAP